MPRILVFAVSLLLALACVALAQAPSNSNTAPAKSPAALNATSETIKQVQARLKELGLYTGTVDGFWGPRTNSAVVRFQTEHGIVPTGALDETTLAQLIPNRADAPAPSSANAPGFVDRSSSIGETGYAAAALTIAAIAGSLFALFRRRAGRRNDAPGKIKLDRDLSLLLRKLVSRAWGMQEMAEVPLNIAPRSISQAVSDEQFIALLLRHVSRVAPALEVPRMTPRVVISGTKKEAGQFIIDDGWVSIAVSPVFVGDLAAARAILCHELCHYVLEANGIRDPSRETNEKMTDIAMFVFGLGDVFLEGYRSKPGLRYREGHRLGYLTNVEYRGVYNEVVRLRRTGELQSTALEAMEKKFRSRISDLRVRKRLLVAERAKHPEMSEVEIITRILDSYERDRR